MPTNATKPYQQRRYLAEALDPIHVGTGEFQLGRVDNTIVREPGTNLPKIPGSSIGGVARAYTAMDCGKYLRPDGHSCAGKGGSDGDKHCGSPDCPVCTCYGFSKNGRSFQGLAQFSDAQIVFFPVYSAIGPIWLTSRLALTSAGISISGGGSFPDPGDKVILFAGTTPEWINLGWLFLEKCTAPHQAGGPEEWSLPGGQKLSSVTALGPILTRLALVSDTRYSILVEDQLEIRTSVSINPESGAAEDGALFTAESIPRGCFFSFVVTHLDPNNFRVPDGNGGSKIKRAGSRDATVDDIENDVWKGLDMIQFLGIGGVNTRGMGRLRVIRTEDR